MYGLVGSAYAGRVRTVVIPVSAAGGTLLAMLTDADRAILDFDAAHWKYAGAKEARIREKFGISATRYYQILNHLIDKPTAFAHHPLLVKRLHRMRDARRTQRAAIAHGFDIG